MSCAEDTEIDGNFLHVTVLCMQPLCSLMQSETCLSLVVHGSLSWVSTLRMTTMQAILGRHYTLLVDM
jgi:hypothetical protein